MTNTVKILLTCPNCGNSNWRPRNDDEAEGAFECAACGDLVFPEDMSSEVKEPATSNNRIPTEFDIAKLITISSCHIEEDVSYILDAEPNTNKMGLSIYPKSDYGWFIYIPEYLSDKENRHNIPKSLSDCIDFTITNKCEWLCIDCDGPEYDNLPKYNW